MHTDSDNKIILQQEVVCTNWHRQHNWRLPVYQCIPVCNSIKHFASVQYYPDVRASTSRVRNEQLPHNKCFASMDYAWRFCIIDHLCLPLLFSDTMRWKRTTIQQNFPESAIHQMDQTNGRWFCPICEPWKFFFCSKDVVYPLSLLKLSQQPAKLNNHSSNIGWFSCQ